jgi:hypothetical protein
MTLSFASKYTLAALAGAAWLAGCASGGSITPSGAIVEGQAPKARGVAKSWMSPDARNRNLIYVSDSAAYDVYVYSFPKGDLVGTLTDQNNPAGLCTDAKRDVFVTQLYGHQIVEYRPGKTTPVKTLSDPGYEPGACSVNPATGDLAVANIVSDEFAQGNLLVYPKATGNPTTYLPPGGASGSWFSVNDVGYDDFTSTAYFAGTCNGAFCAGELPNGSSDTENITLTVSPTSPGTVQFDGAETGDITFDDQTDGTVYAYKFSGTSGTEVGSTKLSGSSDVNGSWIVYVTHRKSKRAEAYVLAPQQNGADALLYSYPFGGSSLRAFTGVTQPFGATYSGYGHTTF